MKTYVYDKDCNLIKTYLDGTEEEIRAMEGKEVYLSEIVFINPILDNENIREMKVTEMIKAGIITLFDGQYLKNEEIITVEKPNDFYLWDSKKKKWIYQKEWEQEALENELGELQIKIDDLEQRIENFKAKNQNFAVKRLEKELAKLTVEYDSKLLKYKELGGIE